MAAGPAVELLARAVRRPDRRNDRGRGPGGGELRQRGDGTVKKGFKAGQILSASMVALAHGTNDAQKTMGIITLTLITAGLLPKDAGRRSG